MSLSGAAWTSDLVGRFAAKGFTGSELNNFASFVGNGSASHVIGKHFVTVDVGSVPGAGIGHGVGITGLSAPNISNGIFSSCTQAFGQSGSKLKDFCDAVAAACVANMALATLATVDSPVFVGAGTITPGSITVDPSGWGSAIQTQGASFSGAQWGNFAHALGTAQANEVKSHGTGSVVIAGAGSPTPVPGGGAGTGTIS